MLEMHSSQRKKKNNRCNGADWKVDVDYTSPMNNSYCVERNATYIPIASQYESQLDLTKVIVSKWVRFYHVERTYR